MSQEILHVLASDREINEIVREFQEAFNKVLNTFLIQKARESGHLSPLAGAALAGRRAFSLQRFTMRGGKRIRPLIFCCGYLCVGGTDGPSILKASVAIELLQTALIIHDDVVDRSAERRSGPTMHLLWQNYFRESGARYPVEHLGTAMAVLMGDIASTLASEILVRADFPCEEKLRAAHTLSDVVYRVALGELLDVALAHKPLATLTEPQILKVYELKTAGYTTEGPLHIGAVLGGAEPKQLKLLSEYAIPLGVAFQIQDDLLGLFGERSAIGKDEGSDLLEAKRTPLLLKAWQESSRAERALLEMRTAERAHLRRVRSLIVQSGALRYALVLITRNFQRAYASLEDIGVAFGPTAARLLGNVAHYLEERADYKRAIAPYADATR